MGREGAGMTHQSYLRILALIAHASIAHTDAEQYAAAEALGVEAWLPDRQIALALEPHETYH